MKKKKLRLKTKWKVTLVIIILIAVTFSVIKYIDYMRNKARECDLIKGYTCSFKEVEDFIKYGI